MSIKIVKVTNSDRPSKRLCIVISYNEVEYNYHFGLNGGRTYLDHKDKNKRDAYRKRHYANKKEKQLIDNNIPSPALFSYRLLWGDSSNLKKNIEDLQKVFNTVY